MADKVSMREKTLKIERYVSYLLPVVIFSLALWTLDRQIHHLHSMYIVKSISSTPLSHIELALFLTFLSYLALTGYDYLAVRHINNPMPYKQTARVSFISTSISYSVGFNFLTGSSLRYRLYSRNGLTLTPDMGNYSFLHSHLLDRFLLCRRLALHILSCEIVGLHARDPCPVKHYWNFITAVSCYLFLFFIQEMESQGKGIPDQGS